MNIGDKLIVRKGPFAGLECEIVAESAGGHFEVDVSIYGRMARASLAEDDIRPITKREMLTFISCLTGDELKTLRAMIKVKLGKWTIS